MSRSLIFTFLLAAVVASFATDAFGLLPTPAPGQRAYETIALTGDAAPGTGVHFSILFNSVINDAGQIAFLGILTGPDVDITNQRGIWITDASGTMELVARSGDPAPGADPGGNFDGFETPRLNEAGQIAFFAFFTNPGVNNIGIWVTDTVSGTPELVALTDTAAPGTNPAFTFGRIRPPVINDAGQTSFFGFLDDNGGSGVWATDAISGALVLIAREGEAAPGTGANFGRVLGDAVLNGGGQAAFLSNLNGIGVDNSNDRAIWVTDAVSGMPELVARSGDPVPGAGPGVDYGRLDTPVINDAGQIAFFSPLIGTAVDGTNDQGIVVTDAVSGTRALAARSGDVAPGTGANFRSFTDPVLNEAGQTAFRGILTGPGVDGDNERGVWTTDAISGTPRLVAREGDAAPGAPGVTFSVFGGDLLLNGAGQTVFFANLEGAVDNSNDRGIWATNRHGVLTYIVREGDVIDVSNDPLYPDFRTIEQVDYLKNTGNQDGRPSPFNDLGQLMFQATFTDGSEGLFLSSAVAIPEPCSGLLVILACALGLWRTRSRFSGRIETVTCNI